MRLNALPTSGFILITFGALLWRFLPALDLVIFDRLRLSAADWLTRPMAIFTAMGGAAALIPVALIVVVALQLRGRRADAIWLLATIASGRLAVEGMKELFERPRPPIADRLALVTSHSFPSSHAAGTMMTLLALALLLAPHAHRWQVFAILGAVAIGLSRVALGVHWPSDVLAGLGFGLLWVGLAARWRPRRAVPS